MRFFQRNHNGHPTLPAEQFIVGFSIHNCAFLNGFKSRQLIDIELISHGGHQSPPRRSDRIGGLSDYSSMICDMEILNFDFVRQVNNNL